MADPTDDRRAADTTARERTLTLAALDAGAAGYRLRALKREEPRQSLGLVRGGRGACPAAGRRIARFEQCNLS